MRKTYKGKIRTLKPNQIFVYGQNTQARNGKGAAHHAMKFGAQNGVLGLSGQTYGIITKDLTKKVQPSRTPEQIIAEIEKLYLYALENLSKEFLIAYSVSDDNLNKYSPSDMASFFKAAGKIPENIVFESEFSKLIFIQDSIF